MEVWLAGSMGHLKGPRLPKNQDGGANRQNERTILNVKNCSNRRRELVPLVSRYMIPAIYNQREYVLAGGLSSKPHRDFMKYTP